MPDKITACVEAYFSELRRVHALGAGTKERSYYPAFADLLNAIGADLRPKVFCLSDLANTGSGHPDFGLFAAGQVQKGEPCKGQMPERGVIEMKGLADDTWQTAGGAQVTRYFDAYRLVIVSNLREFVIVGEAPDGRPVRLESFTLAQDPGSFWAMAATPRKSAEAVGRAFGEFLRRALTQSVALREPKDVAWFLASYARDALNRVDEAGERPALQSVRTALEQALGIRFDSDKGYRFFRSTLVQTLFYGVFSAWVLWSREAGGRDRAFDWRTAIWHLAVPFIRTLFQQIADPAHLRPLNLVEVMDWTAATLNRVDRTAFFARFSETDAVQYFYEPFLEAFDPELRRDLGVWYTPNEVVDYMVARVDRALRDELGVADGLASEQVYVLDPCCGTGAYLSAVLRRIDATLASRGLGALRGQMVKKAAVTRVFGFEIMPAPFVVAHLKTGLTLMELQAPLDEHSERAAIYLTNALTGWEPHTDKPLAFPELEQERAAAGRVKHDTPILVILGNPPYNGQAGMAVDEERALSEAYRTTSGVRKPKGQGLNDLYVRFFRMAERRIADKTERGIVCFISNYSWLDGLSFTGMRERFLEAFDAIRIDVLNGDKYKTGKTTPDGLPDPSIFSTAHNREGIQVGTAIATLVRKAPPGPRLPTVQVRQLWGTGKWQELVETAEAEPGELYASVAPKADLGLPFVGGSASAEYFQWPMLTELFVASFSGVQTNRDQFVIDIDPQTLEKRIEKYFSRDVPDDLIGSLYPTAMASSYMFYPKKDRQFLIERGIERSGFKKYYYRPFDVRHIYYEEETRLLGSKALDYYKSYPPPTDQIIIPKSQRKIWSPPLFASALIDLNCMDGGATSLPFAVRGILNCEELTLNCKITNSIPESVRLSLHCLAVLHSPLYFLENHNVMRLNVPRVPLPGDAALLSASAALGEELSRLLDPETPAPGVSTGAIRAGLATLGVPERRGSGPLDLALTAGWGSTQTAGSGGSIVMPGRGRTASRDYTPAERAALADEGAALGLDPGRTFALLGARTLDVHLNDKAVWSNVPERVWAYTLGGYQVVKKWLSYRERPVLGRPLRTEEALYVAEMVRRIAAILLLGPALDANYDACKAAAVPWKDGKPAPGTLPL